MSSCSDKEISDSRDAANVEKMIEIRNVTIIIAIWMNSSLELRKIPEHFISEFVCTVPAAA